METVNPALDSVGSPLKPVDDTPNAEHTTPPELEKEFMDGGKVRGYARKSRAKFKSFACLKFINDTVNKKTYIRM